MDQIKRPDVRPFTVVYNDFLDSEGLLTTNEKILMIHLMRYGNQAFPSVGTLCSKTGLSRRTVQRTVDTLVEKGFLRKEGRTNPKDGGTTSNIYTIIERPEVWKAKTIEEATRIAKLTEIDRAVELLIAAGYDVKAKEKPVSESQHLSETSAPLAIADSKNGFQSNSKYSTETENCQVGEATPDKPEPSRRELPKATRRLERYTLEDLRYLYDYDALAQRNPYYTDLVDTILSVIYDAVNTGKEYLRIGGDEKPAEIVRSRLLKLDCETIDYVLELYNKQTQRIEYPLPWLLTVLFTAKDQMNADITNQVRYDGVV